MSQNFQYIVDIFPDLLKGLGLTLKIGTSSFVLALIIGIIFLILYSLDNSLINSIIRIYVSFFRGTPLLMQLFLFYYGIPMLLTFMTNISAELAIIICMGINGAAGIFEALRGGISAVDHGQYEASIAFGMSHLTALRRIVFPQGIVNAIPAISNTLMSMLLMSSVGMTIGIQELTGRAQLLTATTYRTFETYFVAILLYWVLSLILTRLQNLIEISVSKKYRR